MAGLQLWLWLAACSKPEKGGDSAAPADTWSGGGSWETDWEAPACDAVTGSAALTWTADGGATVAPTDGTLDPNAQVRAILPLAAPGAVIAVRDGELYRSADAGCTWTAEALSDRQDRDLVLGPGDIVWGWSETLDTLLRIDGATVTSAPAPDEPIVGLGVDPADADHLRAGDGGCNIYESLDGGQSWALLFEAPVTTLQATSVAFDPDDLDRVICAQTHEALWLSTDGGDRWDQGRGLTSAGELKVFTALFVPGEPEGVWAHGVYTGADARDAVFRSSDGGLNWVEVLSEADGVSLASGARLAVHPGAPNVLAIADGPALYTYDAAEDHLTTNTPVAERDIQGLAACPASPGMWYLGLGYDDYGS